MPKPIPPTAAQIREARLSANLSQPELAARMAGISEEDALRFTTCLRSLREWEQGLRQPDYENTRKLQQLLNLQETDREHVSQLPHSHCQRMDTVGTRQPANIRATESPGPTNARSSHAPGRG